MRAAKVFMNKIPAGELRESADGSFTFRYDDDYFADPGQSSISLTLPKTQQEYRSETFFPFFFNILSEGVNKQIQTRRFKIDEEDYLGLLMLTARNDVIGAVTIESLDL
jgi:serine/threonine-protein kinase HipA